MFDIGWDEMLFTAVVAIIVIGPKDMPRALRTAGRWVGKMRRVSGHFRSGVEAMIRDAELAEMQEKWRKQNDDIMRAHPDADAHPDIPADTPPAVSAEAAAQRHQLLHGPEAAAPPAEESQPSLPLPRS